MGLIEELDVDLDAELGGQAKALHVIAHEEAAHHQLACLVGANDGQDVDDGDIAEKFIAGPVQDPPHRIIGPPHDPLHAHHRAQVVAAMNAQRAGRAYQDVLVVIGHADDFVRHHLADGKHQVEASLGDHAVHLRRPGVVEQAA